QGRCRCGPAYRPGPVASRRRFGIDAELGVDVRDIVRIKMQWSGGKRNERQRATDILSTVSDVVIEATVVFKSLHRGVRIGDRTGERIYAISLVHVDRPELVRSLCGGTRRRRHRR